ncbi:MFS transporter [Clostridium sp. Cult2]|uniref:MFS transporter n=1 Tax=Clostridium sp. Cult2 TaxID=2079003 RepID=UPI001F01BA39|nr:MFS transporter [Clostridium sp. Cult2]MCF6465486.1 hypothetical protein [Clostridium sp. Cult2]
MEESYSIQEEYLEYNIRTNIINGILATAALNLVNPYFAKFAERLGATDYQIAYLTSLPHFFSILAFIPGAILIESLKNKQKVVGSIMLIQKFFYLFMAFIPFLNLNQASLFIFLVGFMNLPGAIGNMGYQSSMGDVFLTQDRGKAMGLRYRYSSTVGIIITFISGRLLTSLPKSPADTIKLYQIFFIIAFVLAFIEVVFYFKFKGVNKNEKVSSNYIASLKDVIKNLPKRKKFIIFTICSLFFHIGWVGAQPLFNIYIIKILKANETWLSIMSIASGISSIATYTKWASFAEKKGNGIALTIAIIGMGITPILYALSRSLFMLVLFNIIIGVSVAGTTSLLFSILLEIIPNNNRTIYIGVYNTMIAIISAISPILGVKIMNMTNIKISLIIIAVIRLTASILFYTGSNLTKKHPS